MTIFYVTAFSILQGFLPHNGNWKNWAGNQQCNPAAIVQPASLRELQDVIKKGAEEKKQIRAFGAKHSWSDIVCTRDLLIDTNHLDKIISIENQTKQVRVQAGVTLKKLVHELANQGLALPNQPAILDQAVAGAFLTATHGTGHTGTLADFVKEIEFVGADGRVYTVSATDRPELFAAARVSVGSLGIVYAVTLQCEPLFMLEAKEEGRAWSALKNNYLSIYKDNNYFQFFIDPYSENTVITTWNRTMNNDRSWFTPIKKFATHMGKSTVQTLTEWVPGLVRTVSDWWTRYTPARSSSATEYSYEALSGKVGIFYLEEEIAVGLDRLDEALTATITLLKEYGKKNIFVSGILVRFVNGEQNSLLSPVAQRDSAFISVTSAVTDEFDQLYKDLYTLLVDFGGRPHWGKINFLNYDDAKKLYGDNFEKFVAIRKQLDPDGVFSNAFTKRVFGW